MVCLPRGRTGSDAGPCRGCSYRSPRVTLRDQTRVMLVDLVLHIGITARTNRDTARKFAGPLQTPEMRLGIRDAFGLQCFIGNKTYCHLEPSERRSRAPASMARDGSKTGL